MNRRQCLAAVSGLASLSVAGCTALGGETVLDAPTEQRDGRSVYYRFEHGGEEVLRVSFATSSATAARRVRAYVEQPAETTLDRYRFRFKPDPTGDGSADVYLRPPPVGHADEFDTHRDAGWAVVEGAYEDDRRVTTGVEILVFGDVDGDGGHPDLLVDYEVRLAGDGYLDDRYLASDRRTLEFRGSGAGT